LHCNKSGNFLGYSGRTGDVVGESLDHPFRISVLSQKAMVGQAAMWQV
jgi:hypothetical protein